MENCRHCGRPDDVFCPTCDNDVFCRVCGVLDTLDSPVSDESAYEPLCLSCWHWWQITGYSLTIAETMTRVIMEGLFREDQAHT